MRRVNIDEVTSVTPYDYYRFYLRISRIFGIIWFCLTICITLCLILIFIQPNWIGDTVQSPYRGFFGLNRFCVRYGLGYDYYCFGTWKDFSTLPDSHALKAACVFIGLSILLCFILFIVLPIGICIKFERIIHVCAWIQFVITIFIFIAVTIYPASWNLNIIRYVCGNETDQYKIGTCSLRWPYIVACILVFQSLFQTIFAFVLAARQAKYILLYTEHGKFVYKNKFPSQHSIISN